MSAEGTSEGGMSEQPEAGVPAAAPAASEGSAASKQGRGRRVTVVGTVVSDKMDKTIKVQQDRMVKHPLYGKYIRRSTTYKAHDENNDANVGDQVEIAFDRPISKTKNWRLVKVLRTSRMAGIQLQSGEEEPE